MIIQHLTDSSKDATLKRSRVGLQLALNNADKTDTQVTALFHRVISRQWGNATPAQALLYLSEVPQGTLPQRSAEPVAHAPWTQAEKDQINRHWANVAETKDHNLAIQILTGCWGKVGKDGYTSAASWLCHATQDEIQAVIKDILARRTMSVDGAKIILEKRNGLEGWLLQGELLPWQPKGKPQEADDNGFLDMFSDNKGGK